MRSVLVRCYPARWRARYGDEFLAILEERPLGPYDVADILLGALDARLRSRRAGAATSHGRGLSMSLRVGGFAAILGAVLWAVAGLSSTGVVGIVDDGFPVVMLMTGMVVLLVAMAGLSAFQARSHHGTIWVAFAVTAIGTLAFFVGYIGSNLDGEGFWGLWFIGVLTVILGSGLFAAVTYRTRVLSRVGAALIGIGIVIILSEAVVSIAVLIPLGMSCFAFGWLTLGVEAVRVDRPATMPA